MSSRSKFAPKRILIVGDETDTISFLNTALTLHFRHIGFGVLNPYVDDQEQVKYLGKNHKAAEIVTTSNPDLKVEGIDMKIVVSYPAKSSS